MPDEEAEKPQEQRMTPERFARAWVMSESMREDLGLPPEHEPPRDKRKRSRPPPGKRAKP